MNKQDNKREDLTHKSSKSSPSIFGALCLIGAGVYLILHNLGWIDGGLNWAALLTLWPVFLIFGGLSLLTQQISGRTGRSLNRLVSFVAFSFALAVLLYGHRLPWLDRYATADVHQERVTIARDGVKTADITLDFISRPVNVYALTDSSDLLDADISYTGEFKFTQDRSGDNAEVSLEVNSSPWWHTRSWDEGHNWEIGLNSAVETDLNLDMGSGSSNLDLSELNLVALSIDGGSGRTELSLPEGAYETTYDVGSGFASISVPNAGMIDLDIDGGSGAIEIVVPPTMQVSVDVQDGSGAWIIKDDRLRLVEQDGDDSLWETADYTAEARNRLNLKIDIGSGAITFTNP